LISETGKANSKPGPTAVVLVAFAIAMILGIMAARGMTIRTFAVHDDMHYMRQALSLLRLQWLGSYDNLTLAKGPGFPAFLAIGHLTGLPFAYFQLGTLLASLAVFSWTLSRLLNKVWLFPVVALTLFLIPSLYVFNTAQVLRETLFIALTFLLLSALMASAVPGLTSCKSWIMGIGGGLALGALWLTREEGVTILPAVAVFCAWGLIRLKRTWRSANRDTGLVSAIGVMVVMFLIVLGGYGAINKHVYGRFVVNEAKSGNFARAMTALQRASYPHWRPLVPVPRAARMKIYRESPTFKRLESYFDPKNASPPWNIGCEFASQFPIYKATCGEIAGGWWMWSLRDAAASVGAYQNATASEKFFGFLADEVEGACSSGRLVCAPWLPPLIPPMTAAQWRQLPDRVWQTIDVFALGISVNVAPNPSTLAPEWRQPVNELLNYPRVAGDEGYRYRTLSGWYWRTGGGFFHVDGVNDGKVVSIQRQDSPDIAAGIDPEALHQRFQLVYQCPPKDALCPVRFVEENGGQGIIADLSKSGPDRLSIGDGVLNIDVNVPVNEPLTSIRTYVYDNFVRLLGALVPLYRGLCALGAVAFLVAVVRHRRGWLNEPALVVASALLLGVFTRAVVLALIDLTSWPTLTGYLYPASGPPLMITFALLCIISAFTSPKTAVIEAGMTSTALR